MFTVFFRTEERHHLGSGERFNKILFLSKRKKKVTGKRIFVKMLHKILIFLRIKEQTIEEMVLSSMPVREQRKEKIISMVAYEKEEELTEQISSRLTEKFYKTAPEVKDLEKNSVYGIMKNWDMTEGRGGYYIWVLTTNSRLASKLAWGNGISGSDAEIEIFSFDKDYSDGICPFLIKDPPS